MTPSVRNVVPSACDLLSGSPKGAAGIPVTKPGGFALRTPHAVRLRMPPLSQYRLHDTYWAGRWGVRARALVATYDKPGNAAVRQGLAGLTAAVEAAPYGCSKGAAQRIRAAHRGLVQALKGAGAKPRELRRLNRDHKCYERWWKSSGATACALAAERGLRLLGGRPTRYGRFTSRARRRLFSRTPLYAGYLKHRRRRAAKLYKGRYATYNVRYIPARLQQAARRIIARLRAGQPVHARVLSGYLHRDTGRHPKASHSVVIDGYTRLGGTDRLPLKVDFHFTDPDGGKGGVLRLDVASGRFEHVPVGLCWCDRGPDGWDYDTPGPPYRYQVLSIR